MNPPTVDQESHRQPPSPRRLATASTLESQLGHDAYVLEAGKLTEFVRQSLGW